MKVTYVQKCDFSQILNTIFSTFSGGACPGPPLEGLKKFFIATAWLKKIFQDWLPSKQKILDRTLAAVNTKLDLIKFSLTLNLTMLADGLWAISITKLTAGAKHFCKVLPSNRSLTYSKILLTDNTFGQ